MNSPIPPETTLSPPDEGGTAHGFADAGTAIAVAVMYEQRDEGLARRTVMRVSFSASARLVIGVVATGAALLLVLRYAFG